MPVRPTLPGIKAILADNPPDTSAIGQSGPGKPPPTISSGGARQPATHGVITSSSQGADPHGGPFPAIPPTNPSATSHRNGYGIFGQPPPPGTGIYGQSYGPTSYSGVSQSGFEGSKYMSLGGRHDFPAFASTNHGASSQTYDTGMYGRLPPPPGTGAYGQICDSTSHSTVPRSGFEGPHYTIPSQNVRQQVRHFSSSQGEGPQGHDYLPTSAGDALRMYDTWKQPTLSGSTQYRSSTANETVSTLPTVVQSRRRFSGTRKTASTRTPRNVLSSSEVPRTWGRRPGEAFSTDTNSLFREVVDEDRTTRGVNPARDARLDDIRQRLEWDVRESRASNQPSKALKGALHDFQKTSEKATSAVRHYIEKGTARKYAQFWDSVAQELVAEGEIGRGDDLRTAISEKGKKKFPRLRGIVDHKLAAHISADRISRPTRQPPGRRGDLE